VPAELSEAKANLEQIFSQMPPEALKQAVVPTQLEMIARLIVTVERLTAEVERLTAEEDTEDAPLPNLTNLFGVS